MYPRSVRTVISEPQDQACPSPGIDLTLLQVRNALAMRVNSKDKKIAPTATKVLTTMSDHMATNFSDTLHARACCQASMMEKIMEVASASGEQTHLSCSLQTSVL